MIDTLLFIDGSWRGGNRLDFGLAAHTYTNSATPLSGLARDVEAGVLGVNHQAVAPPETPFGGIKDLGYGPEGGSEILDSYMETRLVTHLANR
jgi:succinate-semialdehyde dehydrogenase / glutarate-semialdehyde dehydrogenase